MNTIPNSIHKSQENNLNSKDFDARGSTKGKHHSVQDLITLFTPPQEPEQGATKKKITASVRKRNLEKERLAAKEEEMGEKLTLKNSLFSRPLLNNNCADSSLSMHRLNSSTSFELSTYSQSNSFGCSDCIKIFSPTPREINIYDFFKSEEGVISLKEARNLPLHAVLLSLRLLGYEVIKASEEKIYLSEGLKEAEKALKLALEKFFEESEKFSESSLDKVSPIWDAQHETRLLDLVQKFLKDKIFLDAELMTERNKKIIKKYAPHTAELFNNIGRLEKRNYLLQDKIQLFMAGGASKINNSSSPRRNVSFSPGVKQSTSFSSLSSLNITLRKKEEISIESIETLEYAKISNDYLYLKQLKSIVEAHKVSLLKFSQHIKSFDPKLGMQDCFKGTLVEKIVYLINENATSLLSTINTTPLKLIGKILVKTLSLIEDHLERQLNPQLEFIHLKLLENLKLRESEISSKQDLKEKVIDNLIKNPLENFSDIERILVEEDNIIHLYEEGQTLAISGKTADERFYSLLEIFSARFFGSPHLFKFLIDKLKNFYPEEKKVISDLQKGYEMLINFHLIDRERLNEEVEKNFSKKISLDQALIYLKISYNFLQQNLVYLISNAMLNTRRSKFRQKNLSLKTPRLSTKEEKNQIYVIFNEQACEFKYLRRDGLVEKEAILTQLYSFKLPYPHQLIHTELEIFFSGIHLYFSCPQKVFENHETLQEMVFDLKLIGETFEIDQLDIQLTSSI
ncbi:hypothetical protein [Neochlamydia sp. S13]|uniref:hypothetical protein n=1 Tax=Neochlamydia sp. S13 TaxID=1353976 RepID=UPI0005A877EB|nr:hypothetical protein [Neochlamydia sp. S13]BBI16468.1 hypothetical protein NCS13_1_0273 [Neochlamydia sp. S13]